MAKSKISLSEKDIVVFCLAEGFRCCGARFCGHGLKALGTEKTLQRHHAMLHILVPALLGEGLPLTVGSAENGIALQIN